MNDDIITKTDLYKKFIKQCNTAKQQLSEMQIILRSVLKNLNVKLERFFEKPKTANFYVDLFWVEKNFF